MSENPTQIDNEFRLLRCIIEGEGDIFEARVPCIESVSFLKGEIKKEGELDTPKRTLELWKVDIDLNPHDKKSLRHIKVNENASDVEELSWKSIGQYWENQPPFTRLQIIVRIIEPTTLSPSSSIESSVPSTSDYWSPRSDTVRRLYEVLREEKLVYVRGTPGCGKTTLMKLLHAHILQEEPSAFVKIQHSWPPQDSGSALDQRLKVVDPAYPRRDGLAFLLLDEGQDSYSDHILWNAFFKGVSDGGYPRNRVILFCSYGSPSSRPIPHRIGTPLALRDAARISLWPTEKSIGMLFNRSEFDEVVARFERPLNLHADLQDLIFDWTVGHAGAVVELLRLISYQRVSEGRRGVKFTVEAFHNENPTHDLVRRLRGGAFEHGLPQNGELLGLPDVAAVFRTLLRDGVVYGEEDKDEAIRKCHRHGWVYADRSESWGIVAYMLPSPLHTVCLSWMLDPTNDMPHFSSLFDLSFEVISKFKPSQLHLPIHRFGSLSTVSPPEAQYQDEFYRSVLSVTFGNVRLSPEFASARGARVAGRIDFFIPVVKWGIEFTRDGNQLEKHSSRFANSGAYGAWLTSGDMADYILLDCRTSIPQKKHPNIPNLYHVVFSDEYQEVVVYDNLNKVVRRPIVLQENH